MCGIIGYIGEKKVIPVIINGLRRMEYRGYDSSGIAAVAADGIRLSKKPGKLVELENVVNGANDSSIEGSVGIGHTRWATHGEPNEINAHPHVSFKKKIAIIHNGIIENYIAIREELSKKGYVFYTETDTEALANLIEEHYGDETALEEAVRLALLSVNGTYGIAVISAREPEKIVTARQGSPIVLGYGDG